MKRNRAALATTLGIAAPLLLAGCGGGLADASYTAVRDGAQSALFVTLSFSADLANWLEEPSEPQEPSCALDLRG